MQLCYSDKLDLASAARRQAFIKVAPGLGTPEVAAVEQLLLGLALVAPQDHDAWACWRQQGQEAAQDRAERARQREAEAEAATQAETAAAEAAAQATIAAGVLEREDLLYA